MANIIRGKYKKEKTVVDKTLFQSVTWIISHVFTTNKTNHYKIYRIATVLKIENDIITNISASTIGDNSNIV
jgi:hypothetical protein